METARINTVDWESAFGQWAQPPGASEQQRCENAEKTVRTAIAQSSQLKYRNITVFTQGSYRNRVNVRKDSDVDVGILCKDTFFPDYPEGMTAQTLGTSPASYDYATFKNEVEQALVDHFGRRSVSRGNKAFTVRENSYHVEADVAPFFEHRRYVLRPDGSYYYLSGVELLPDNGGVVINWPEQHYDNGVRKNTQTQRAYKGTVRILKTLRAAMEDNGDLTAQAIPGFLVECLVWNVPNFFFQEPTWDRRVQKALASLSANLASNQSCDQWCEVSELKYLFRPSQKWTREQALAFVSRVWGAIGVRP